MDNQNENQDPFAGRVPEWMAPRPRQEGSVPPPKAPRVVQAQRTTAPIPAGPKPERGAERKRRARRIRTITVTGAVTGFCAVWSVVYTQMASGNDPALGNSGATSVASTNAAGSISSATTAAAKAAKAKAAKIAAAKKAAAAAAADDSASAADTSSSDNSTASSGSTAVTPSSTSSSTGSSSSNSNSSSSNASSASSSPAPATSSQS